MGSALGSQVVGPNLFGRTRSALLALLYGHADQSFYLRQLVRAVGAGHGALQRELKHLTDMGLVVRRVQGNQVLYQANSQSPIFLEIKSLITKSVGTHDAIRSALVSLGSEIQIAFVYGSVARGEEKASSDIDLMVVGAVSLDEILDAVGPLEKSLRRPVNPTIYSLQELKERIRAGNHFLRSLATNKKVFLIGDENGFREAGGTRLVEG